MSRQSKNARNLAKARDITKMHLNGEKGPSKTTPQHGKKSAWWQKFQTYSSFIKGGKKGGQRQEEAVVEA
jgi:hypothetical protein